MGKLEERFYDAHPQVYKDQKKEQARQLFDDVDEDGSGYLDRHELRRVSASLGYDMSDDDLATAMREMDEDCSGEVTFS
eukprot:SAG31_NODE_17937_length_652_cov_1.311031_2_plen_78_part_01